MDLQRLWHFLMFEQAILGLIDFSGQIRGATSVWVELVDQPAMRLDDVFVASIGFEA